MTDTAQDRDRFERLFLPHLDAAWNLARWLTGNDAAAHDVVQESCLRAFRFLHRFHGGSERAWLLTIVRNQSYTWLKKIPAVDSPLPDDGEIADETAGAENPETILMRLQDKRLVQAALAELPEVWREVIVLKDIEDMAYKDIANVLDVPIGTVMSRLARGRRALKDAIGKMRSDG